VDRTALLALRRRQRRLSSASFFVAGVGFGTILYLLRARFHLLREEGRYAAAGGLLLVTLAAFWLGARADAEVQRLDEQLRELDREGRRR
jgi:hypothetical protein